MAQISESLEALRKEAPARFLESDQFQEMRKTYEKLKPLADTKPKSFAKQCSEYDFQRIYPVMDAFLSAHDLFQLFDLVFHEPCTETVKKLPLSEFVALLHRQLIAAVIELVLCMALDPVVV